MKKFILILTIGITRLTTICCMEKTLYDAVKINNIPLVTWFLTHDPLIIPDTTYQPSSLMVAAQEGHIAMIQFLLNNAHASLEARDSRGWTALTYACFYDKPQAVIALLLAGADPHTKCVANWTPLLYATLKGATSCARQLFFHTPDKNKLRAARVWRRDTALDVAERWPAVYDRDAIKIMMNDSEKFKEEMTKAQRETHQFALEYFVQKSSGIVRRLRDRELGIRR